MIQKIALGVLAVLVLVAIFIATRPAQFRVSRSASMNSPAEVVFVNINDFHNWQHWSPWAKLDPTMKTTFSGPASGLGASYSWAGNGKVGEGKMTITDSKPFQSVTIDLEFEKPMQAKNLAVFTIKSTGDKTCDVDWTMTGENGFVGKAFAMMMDMDRMVGNDFETGLFNLRRTSEADVKKREDALKGPADGGVAGDGGVAAVTADAGVAVAR
jgi:hypothetical protein